MNLLRIYIFSSKVSVKIDNEYSKSFKIMIKVFVKVSPPLSSNFYQIIHQ